MASSITAIEHKSEFIGYPLKSLKTLRSWRVKLYDTCYQIEYISFKLRNKRQILLDCALIFTGYKKLNTFSYTFNVNSNSLTLTESSIGVDLHINGLSFLVLSKLQGCSLTFASEPDFNLALVPKAASVFSTNESVMEPWETKAKNYRLKPREVEEKREQLLIKPYSKSPLFSNKSSKSLKWLEISPFSTMLSSPIKTTHNQSTASVSCKIKIKNKPRIINHFLFA